MMGRTLPDKPKGHEAREFDMPKRKPVGAGCIGSILGGLIVVLLSAVAVLAPLALAVWLATSIYRMLA